MSEKAAREFIDVVAQSKELSAKVTEVINAGIVPLGAENGFDFTGPEFDTAFKEYMGQRLSSALICIVL